MEQQSSDDGDTEDLLCVECGAVIVSSSVAMTDVSLVACPGCGRTYRFRQDFRRPD